MIYFIGAGPGDPELLTVKGKKILAQCEMVIYAGSLVHRGLLRYARKGREFYDSARLSLEEIIALMEKAHRLGYHVARLHSGDPAIYGAVREQVEELKKRHIPFEIIPGVSSFCAASAALRGELTVPGVSQTVILTRLAGRTPVPEREDLERLVVHGATLVVFLSINRLAEIVEKIARGYPPHTPCAVVYHVTWEDETIIRGTLATILAQVEKTPICKGALFIVGEVLGETWSRSQLYHPSFAHGFRGERE